MDTRALERNEPLGIAPLAVAIPEGGVAVVFRYGAVVLFGAATPTMDNFIASLTPLVTGALSVPERDEVRLLIRPDADQHVDLAGNIFLREKTIERLQLVADILAKSLVLSHYETRIAEIFDGIEPFASTLREKGRAGARSKELLCHIGDVLLMQHKMVGRVETAEKPELLWERPELERLYMRLAEECELRDRDHALDRKLEIIWRRVETLPGLVQTRSSLRVEWYIVLLIVGELLLTTYPLLLNRSKGQCGECRPTSSSMDAAMIRDLQLRRNVLDELELEPTVNAVHIGVSTNCGVVALTGFVASYAERAAAERAARRVKGVMAIAQEIEVRLPAHTKRADDEIAACAVQILKWQAGGPADRIGIKVEKGIITLTGEVDWQFQKNEAAYIVHKLTGVVDVVNEIRIAPRIAASEIKEKIEKALQRSAALDALQVAVQTEGSRVVLTGKVQAWYEREIAEHAAWSAPGVSEVQNYVTVALPRRPQRGLICRTQPILKPAIATRIQMGLFIGTRSGGR